MYLSLIGNVHRDKGDEARSLGKFTMCETGRVRLLKRGKLYLQPGRILYMANGEFFYLLAHGRLEEEVKTRDCDSRLLASAFYFEQERLANNMSFCCCVPIVALAMATVNGTLLFT